MSKKAFEKIAGALDEALSVARAESAARRWLADPDVRACIERNAAACRKMKHEPR